MCGENIRMVGKPFPDFPIPTRRYGRTPPPLFITAPGCLWYGRLGAAQRDHRDLAVGSGAVGGEA